MTAETSEFDRLKSQKNMLTAKKDAKYYCGYNDGLEDAAKHLAARLPYHKSEWQDTLMTFIHAIRNSKVTK